MSGLVVGTFAGALAGTAIYYSFSHSIQTSSRISLAKLHVLSDELAAPEAPSVGPLPASARIVRSDFSSMLKQKWNEDMEDLLNRARNTRLTVDIPWKQIWARLGGGETPSADSH